MKRALLLRMPQSIPQVSRFRRVLLDAQDRNCERSCEGRKTGRSGSPFSRKAEGWKVKESSSVEGVRGRSVCFSGIGGAELVYLPGTGGGWKRSYGAVCEGVEGLGGSGGGIGGVPEDLWICSFGGRAGNGVPCELDCDQRSCAVVWGTDG